MNFKHFTYCALLAVMLAACNSIQETSRNYTGFPTSNHLNAKIEGFEVQTIKEGSGEWLSIAMDPQGRLLVSPRRGDLLRFTIPSDSTGGLQIDTLQVGIKDCQGLLYAYQHLYMMGQNEDTIRGIYRVPDMDGQGNYGTPILMKEVPKNGDHSGHTLALGKNGEIYFLSGNVNRPPEGKDVHQVYTDYRNDHLMPLNSMFGSDQKPPGGYVLKTDSIGSFWNLMSYGLRNPYDMCVSPDGELFTFDSDMEWDFNLPWYRPTRVNHLVSGGDYAWRQSTAKRFDYYPDILPSVQDFGRGSPTATVFGTGAAFPAKYQKALFLGDWSYGRIYAMFLESNGATYSAEHEIFVTGQPLNITDMIVGQDGALYFVTGGNGTDTGLYRVIYTGKEKVEKVELDSELHPNLLLRRKLEAYHFADDQAGLELALQHIGHEDRFVRYAAKTILERNDPQLWHDHLKTAEGITTKMTLLTALIRSDSTDQYQQLIFDELAALPFGELSENDKLGTLRLYAIAFLRSKEIPRNRVGEIYETLTPYYSADSEILNKELSRTLAYLATLQGEGKIVIEKTFVLLESTPDPIQFVHYLEVIRSIPAGWTLEQRSAYRYWITYAKDNLSGGSLFKYFLNTIEIDFDKTLTNKETAWLNNNPLKPLRANYEGPVKPKPKVAQSVFEPSTFATNWKMEDLQFGLELVSSPRSSMLRDFNRGQRMFAKGQCYNCHYMINKGGGFGPEMTLAGNSFSAEDLLTAILEPSKNINSRFQSTVFHMKDDNTIAGRVINEDGKHYVVQASYDPASVQEVPKKGIQSQEEADYSDMPIGLVNTMNREEIMDLLFFIIQVAGKDPNNLEVAVFEDKSIFAVGDSALIEMINFSDRGKIHYTLDGSEPTSNSTLYQVPFFVEETSLVKAKVIDGQQMGNTITRLLHEVDREVNGLNWKLYRNIKEPFQIKANQKPDATGVSYTFDLRPIVEGENSFELHFEGELQIDQAGLYTFYVTQDDAARLYIDGKLVADGSDRRWMHESDGQIKLSAGKHRIKVEYFDNVAFEYLDIQYESAGVSRKSISGDMLFREKVNL